MLRGPILGLIFSPLCWRLGPRFGATIEFSIGPLTLVIGHAG